MTSTLYSRSFERQMKIDPFDALYLRHVQSEEKGVLVRKVVYKEHDFSQTTKFSHQDFMIDNIVALNATHMLKPVMMSDVSNFNVADQFQGVSVSDLLPKSSQTEQS